MSNAVTAATAAPAEGDRSTYAARLFGLALTAVFPALVWTFFLAYMARAFNAAIDHGTLATVGTIIAMFLTIVCAPIMLRD